MTKTLNIFLCGTGTVGGTLLQQIAQQQAMLLTQRNLDLRVVGIADIFNIITDRNGISLGAGFDINTFQEAFRQAAPSSIQAIHDEAIALGMDNLVFVDCTASYDVAALYHDMLGAGIHVVAANKIAAAGDMERYRLLKKTALERGVKYRHETNVGAGLPILSTISDLVASGDKILKIEAVLSGTLNYIFNTISSTTTFSQAVRKAKEERYSEPDPRIDLSGIDVIRKLVILARESGYDISQEDIEKHLFVPDEYFEGSQEVFWNQLPKLDKHFDQLRRETEAAGERLRFIARLENGKGSVSLERVAIGHPCYSLEGSNNIVMLHTERYAPHPMIIQGYGAGAGVTAAGVFADIISIANAQP